VFIDEQVPLEAGFGTARAGLANLARGGVLASASAKAYGEGVAELVRVGPLGAVPGTSKLVEVRFQDLVERDDCAGLAVRWEATGPGGGLFPALDADITVLPAGERSTVLRLSGSYRPPLRALGTALDTAILHRVARATIRGFLGRIAIVIGQPPADAPVSGRH
jgi:hypothetical protein